MAEAAADVADERVGEVHQPLGDAAPAHQLAGEDEERHRHQRERVHAVHHAARDDDPRDGRADQEGRQDGGQSEREYDRNAEQHEDQHAAEQRDPDHLAFRSSYT